MEVIKLGGSESENAAFVAALARELRGRDLLRDPCVLVHGGGRQITKLLASLGLSSSFFEGLRVSPPEVVQVVDMVLGAVGGGVVRCLSRGGVPAVGLRGGDGLLFAKWHPRADVLVRVGEVVDVDTALLRDVLASGRLPVVSPLAVDAHGELLNVNADMAALAVALALGAQKLVFLSSVPGVLRGQELVSHLSRELGEELRAEGHLHDGMVPKVEAALRARAGGVTHVCIRGLRPNTSNGNAVGGPEFSEGTRIV